MITPLPQTRHTVPLLGCTPEPLMNYLKALGILRLVAEQADSAARGYWQDGIFILQSILDEIELVRFFTEKYQPTPILSPWNGDGGFLTESGASFQIIQRIRQSKNTRLAPLQAVISGVQSVGALGKFGAARAQVKELEKKKKAKRFAPGDAELLSHAKSQVKVLKEGIVFQIRNQFPDECLNWLDACMLIEPDGFSASPLLGSGGVDGRMEFSANFLSNALTVLEDPAREGWLRVALLGTNDTRLLDTAIGQFAPGRIGGPNATQGMEGSSMVNPWDFVLMIEGTLFLAGAVSRKLNVVGGSRAAFPFTVRPSGAGLETLAAADSTAARGEIWLHLCNRPSSAGELRALFSEGRAEINGHQCRDGVEFARAVANLGVDRGIRSFSRQGFLRRNGLAFLATSLGRFDVTKRDHVDLLREIDPWLGSFRASCGDNTPARFTSALRAVERAIFDFCRYGGQPFFQAVLIALGQAEAVIAGSPGFREKTKVKLSPLANLSQEWIKAARDDSPEFEIALGLASIHEARRCLGPLRVNLEPVVFEKNHWAWAEKNRAVVWNAADLATNLAAVLSRRLIDGQRVGSYQESSPQREIGPLAAYHPVCLSTVSAFLSGELDDRRINDLLWSLMLCKVHEFSRVTKPDDEPLPSRAYALLKLLFLSIKIGDTLVSPDPALLAILRSGRVDEAGQIASRILRAKGFMPMPYRRNTGSPDLAFIASDTRRLAAALLMPITETSVLKIKDLVIRPPQPNTPT